MRGAESARQNHSGGRLTNPVHKASTQNTERACIVVVQITLADQTTALLGLIVDAVEEVVNLTAADIEPRPFRFVVGEQLPPRHGQG